MPTSNVIDSRQAFLAKRRSKPEVVAEYQMIRRSSIKVMPLPTVRCATKQIRPFLDLFLEYGIARFTIVDERGVVLAGEKHYQATRSPYLPVYVIAGLSDTQKTALRKAYTMCGGSHG